MQELRERSNFLFRSTRGLTLVAIALIALVTAFFGMLSGPMAEFGVRDFVASTFGMDLVQAEREGRIIILYHSIAMAVVAICTYFITDLIPMKTHEKVRINASITVGYICAMIFGLGFAYFGHAWVLHGLYIFGLSLVFFAGVMLAAALWPWRKEYFNTQPEYARTRNGMSLERAAFFTLAVTTLVSVFFGAIPGAYFGNGFESFLAEDIIREPHKDAFQLSVIGHLHIMLALIAVAVALIVGRWLDFKGRLHKWAMPMMITGSIILSLGAWFVVPFEAIAHYIIYAGSGLVMLAALFLVIYGWGMLMGTRLKEKGVRKASFEHKVGALLHDPLKFGALWQMVFMNFTVSGVGIFMAIRLDEIFRVWPWREERILLTGHWHILSGIIATIILLYYGDLIELKGRVRQWYGWLIIICSNLAFASVTVFGLKRLFVSETEQQSLVNWTMILGDVGLFLVLVVLAALMVWRLVDLFKKDGRWKRELAETGYDRTLFDNAQDTTNNAQLASRAATHENCPQPSKEAAK